VPINHPASGWSAVPLLTNVAISAVRGSNAPVALMLLLLAGRAMARARLGGTGSAAVAPWPTIAHTKSVHCGGNVKDWSTKRTVGDEVANGVSEVVADRLDSQKAAPVTATPTATYLCIEEVMKSA
jgi:hypothetical protein